MTIIEDTIITHIAEGKSTDEIYRSMNRFATRLQILAVWRKCFPLAPGEWCAMEDDILLGHYHLGSGEVQKQLEKEGFYRTRIAIRARKILLNRMAKQAA